MPSNAAPDPVAFPSSRRRRRALRASVVAALLPALLVGEAAPVDGPGPQVSLPLPALATPTAPGGWSGFDVSADGGTFWAVTDRGYRVQGALRREDGRLVGIDAGPATRLAPLRRQSAPEPADSEGLDAGGPDGAVTVSHEGWTRLRVYRPGERHATWVRDLPDWARFPKNAGLEALARDGAGRVFTLPERPTAPGGTFPLLRYDPRPNWAAGTWDVAAHITADGGWAAVGADFGPDGAFYLLERQIVPPGFRSRIRRFDLADAPSDPLPSLRGTVIYRSPFGRHGNLEGIGIWRDRAGRLRATMVSDDNGLRLMRGEIVEIVLPGGRGEARF
jgi:hypothetical protein